MCYGSFGHQLCSHRRSFPCQITENFKMNLNECSTSVWRGPRLSCTCSRYKTQLLGVSVCFYCKNVNETRELYKHFLHVVFSIQSLVFLVCHLFSVIRYLIWNTTPNYINLFRNSLLENNYSWSTGSSD